MEDYEVRDLMRRSLDYGRKYGAAWDLHIEINRLMGRASSKGTWANFGAEIVIAAPDEMNTRFQQEIAKLSRLATESGVKLD